MTCLLFCEHLDTLLAERNFYLDIFAFVILKNLLTFSSFSVQVVFFHNLASSIFKFTLVVLVCLSCFAEVILAKIVFFGISIYKKIGQTF